MEGRHSGNGFRYAESDGYLGKYCIVGLHENYISQNVLVDVQSNPFIHFTSYEDIFLREKKNFIQAVGQAIDFTSDNYTGVELDVDCIQHALCSAHTPSGISVLLARQFITYTARHAKAAYLHICEGAAQLPDGRKDETTGKLISYLVSDFIKGMKQVVAFFLQDDTPPLLKNQLENAKKILEKEALNIIAENKTAANLLPAQMLELAYFIRYKFKNNMLDLLSIFGKLDAWYGMSMAVEKYQLTMPSFIKDELPQLEAENLYHLMLHDPVSYNVQLNKSKNFLFLTGANMAGKSTFIKACGTAVYIAHTGMGVPAKNMRLSFFDGILSNINVIDNIARGESYFFNEVQRIKATVQKVSDGKKWLILIDELFKGTNVQDAMKCSSTVIEGLLKIKNSIFILSTHLYEIGDDLKKHPNIAFNYFETAVEDDQLSFSYQLKEGISNDRLGYLILKKEGVVKMLEDI